MRERVVEASDHYGNDGAKQNPIGTTEEMHARERKEDIRSSYASS